MNYKPEYLKEVMGLLCQGCNNMVTKCDSCKNIFSFSDRVYCKRDNTNEHLCQNCFNRKLKQEDKQ
jgi:hypothetical protein